MWTEETVVNEENLLAAVVTDENEKARMRQLTIVVSVQLEITDNLVELLSSERVEERRGQNEW
jgi:aspartokinase